jgi:hypothetical protein
LSALPAVKDLTPPPDEPTAMTTTSPDLVRLTGALEEAGDGGLTQTQISYDVFRRNRTNAQIDSLLTELQAAGKARWEREDPGGGRDRRPTIRWRIISYSDISGGNGSAVPTINVEGPPPGDGWLPLRETRFRAARGVMPAHAARVGKQLWRKSQSLHQLSKT